MTKEKYITGETALQEKAVRETVKLLDEGATIPFIARYRKEKTGNLDEVQILAIQTAANGFDEIEKLVINEGKS